jgi:PhnB protein
MAVNPIPADYAGVTSYLIVRGAARAIDFYQRAFGATELFRLPMGERIGHAEIRIGGGVVMLADEMPEMGHKSPQTLGGTPVSLLFYVPDVDATFARALGAGGTSVKPLQNQFYGDRSGTLTDPFGHVWTVATHVEDVAPDEMDRRMKKAMQEGNPA